MRKIVVAGDLIIDSFAFYTATKLCPEVPGPILKATQKPYESRGGAGLVAAQLRALVPEGCVEEVEGSKSLKIRRFVDGYRLPYREDDDDITESADDRVQQRTAFLRIVIKLCRENPALLIISDYGKGAFSKETARLTMKAAAAVKVPVLVDAKYNWDWWKGAFAFFPNEHEKNETLNSKTFVGKSHIIHKLGSYGCSVDGAGVPLQRKHEVRDPTGAGDIFIAAFAAQLFSKLEHTKNLLDDKELTAINLIDCARFANSVAGISVEHLGTYVVNSGIKKPTFEESAN